MTLTHKQIEHMGAGPELDAAVAEFVFNSPPGLHCHDRQLCQFDEGMADCEECKSFYANKPAPFSTDIAAAWEVVEKTGMLDVSGLRYALWQEDGGGNWVVTMDAGRYVEAPTAPLAICRAALLWALEREESK